MSAGDRNVDESRPASVNARSVLADLLAGFLGLAIVIAAFVTGALGENLRSEVILFGAVFLLAGLLRGAAAPRNPLLKGFLVGLGASVPVCAMALTGVAFTSRPAFVAFVATSFMGAVAGATVRRLWRSRRPMAALASATSWSGAVLLAALLVVPMLVEKFATTHVEYAAPSFSFAAVDGGRITNQSLRGRVAVLAFWATWCAPCREELPRLNALYERHKGNPNIVFLAVNAEHDDLASSTRKAAMFFSKFGFSMPLVISEGDAASSLGVKSLPSLVIIDQRGNVRLLHSGYDGSERLEGIVEEETAALLRSTPDAR